jgi:hypothetical protein
VDKGANDNEDRKQVRSFSDADLAKYASGGLSRQRRAEIEGFLACNPDLASRMMGVLHRGSRTENLRRGKRMRAMIFAGAVAGITFAASAWSMEMVERNGSPFHAPEFVEDALMSRQASRMRIHMKSQFENKVFDRAEIVHSLDLPLPTFPDTWEVLDAQVFPSEEGPAVSLVVDDIGDGQTFYLFAVRAKTNATERPVITRKDGKYIAYWEANGTAYAFSGGRTQRDVETGAALLARPDA